LNKRNYFWVLTLFLGFLIVAFYAGFTSLEFIFFNKETITKKTDIFREITEINRPNGESSRNYDLEKTNSELIVKDLDSREEFSRIPLEKFSIFPLEEFNYEANEEQKTSFSILNSIHFFLFIWFFCIFIINVAHRNLYLILFVTIFFLPDEIRLVRRIYLRRASRSQQNENQC